MVADCVRNALLQLEGAARCSVSQCGCEVPNVALALIDLEAFTGSQLLVPQAETRSGLLASFCYLLVCHFRVVLALMVY